MLLRIARKEFIEMARDGRFRIAGGIVLALLLTSLGLGWQRYGEVTAAHLAAVAQERELWESQGEKNPHSAAHYGVYAFKPTGRLAFLDPGTESYTGVTVWLESHRQNQFLYRPARDGNTLQRFGELTAAAVLQLLIPLLIILLAFSTFAGERESGTLRQVLSLGVNRRDLALGKALGVAAALGLLLVPATLLGSAALASAQADAASGGLFRALGMAGAYLIYLGSFVGVTLAVSARARSARFALITLLAFWVFVCLMAPRATTDLARRLHPTPSAQEFAAALAADKEVGIQGVDYDDYLERRRTELLAEHNAERIEDLPINYNGWRLEVSEEYGNQFFDQHYARLWDQFEAQDRLRQQAGFVAPLLAVRSVSMALAGTDFSHFRRFAEQAELYRRELVGFLNADLRDNAGPRGFGYTQSKEFWERTPSFAYDAPGAGWALAGESASLAALLAWFLVAAVWAWRGALRLEAI